MRQKLLEIIPFGTWFVAIYLEMSLALFCCLANIIIHENPDSQTSSSAELALEIWINIF